MQDKFEGLYRDQGECATNFGYYQLEKSQVQGVNKTDFQIVLKDGQVIDRVRNRKKFKMLHNKAVQGLGMKAAKAFKPNYVIKSQEILAKVEEIFVKGVNYDTVTSEQMEGRVTIMSRFLNAFSEDSNPTSMYQSQIIAVTVANKFYSQVKAESYDAYDK